MKQLKNFILLFGFICWVDCVAAIPTVAESVFKSIQSEDPDALEWNIETLIINHSFEEFLEVMETKRSSEETVFHSIAKVKREEKRFAKFLKNLLQALSPSLEKTPSSKKYTLAGIDISFQNLESEPVAQAAIGGNLDGFLEEFQKLRFRPAIDVLKIIHGTTNDGQTLYGLVEEGFKKVFGHREDFDQIWANTRNQIEEIRKYFRNLPLQKDNKGLQAKDVAEVLGNKRIYVILSNRKPGLFIPSFSRKLPSIMGGSIVSVLSSLWWLDGFGIEGFISITAAGAIGGIVGGTCQNAYNKLSLRRKRILMEK